MEHQSRIGMKRTASAIVVAVVLGFVFGAPVAAQTAPPQAPATSGPTVDQLIALKRVGSPAMSPDGKLVAYTVREVNWEENSYETEVWIADVATGANRQLTNGKKSSASPKWSPDGGRIAFTSDRSDKQQIWIIRPTFGEAEQLTREEEGVGSFAWSPDGKQIAFTMTDPKAEAWKDRDKKYGEFESVDEDQRLTHLWIIDVESKKAKRLTKGSFTVGSFDWSPDGKAIAFDHTVNGDPSNGGTADISIVTLADASIRPLVTQAGPDSRPRWSPDGTKIAFSSAMAQPFYYYTNSHIAVVPAAGGTIVDLTKAFDENASPLAWLKDGILFAASQKTSAHLFRLDPATQAVKQITPGTQWIFSSPTFTADGSTLAFIRSGPKEFPEIWVVSAMTGSLKKLTDMGAQVANWPQPSQEVITWKSTDGTLIEGILHKPANFQAGKRYPLLIVIHGGPTGISVPVPFNSTTTYPIDIWLNKGALVLEPNYRGSAGYGERFRSLNVRNLGIGDAWDVISGIDHLVAQGLVDNDRVGTMGWSQGGYISAFLTTHDSARFKAVSVGAGISNWMTYYVNTDIHPFTRQYLKATPWDDPKIYADTSPMTYIKQAKAPTLIQHGELDKRVPIPNAYELYQGLQDQGVPAKLIVYKGFGHGLTKPKAHRAAMEHNLEWFGKYIWGEAPPPPPKAAARVEPFSGIVNFAPIDDGFACGGAVKAEAAAELKRRGYVSVVNFRKPNEEGAAVEAEKAAIEGAGLKYIAIPWTRTDTDIRPALDAFLAAVKDPANRPMFFHCASANRASAFWAIKRVVVDGWTKEKALAEAETIGLTQEPMRKWAADYLTALGK
jgi:uncharacterized protein (TIGR01244 family)